MKNLYLIRHGQTEYNIKQLYQGQCDSPLTELGIQMAKDAGKYIKDNNITYSYCCSSAIKRAIDTLNIIVSDNLNHDQYVGLNERYFGSLEGKPWVMPVENREKEYLKHNVESLNDVAERVYQTISDIMNKHDDTLIVSHGAAIKSFCKRVKDCPLTEVIPNCAIVHFVFDDKTFHFVELLETTK